jgi:hypothetical protein
VNLGLSKRSFSVWQGSPARGGVCFVGVDSVLMENFEVHGRLGQGAYACVYKVPRFPAPLSAKVLCAPLGARLTGLTPWMRC